MSTGGQDGGAARARQRELRSAGVVAARDARQRLARAVALLDEDATDPAAAQLASELSLAVGALYGCEVGEAAAVLDKLREASGVLSGVLARVHGPASGTRFDEAGALVAASLAVLYPVRAGLERDLAAAAASERARQAPTLPELTTPADAAIPATPTPAEAMRVGESFPGGPTLVDLQPPVHVEDPAHTSGEAAALFPDASDDGLPPLLLAAPRGGRARRQARELVRDGRGELVDLASGEYGALPATERRSWGRVELKADIGLHTSTQFYAGLSNDISEGGIFVATVQPLPIGSEVVLSFMLPSGHAVATHGRVAWLSSPRDEEGQPGMGVRFERLEPHHRTAIEGFLRHRPAMLHEV